MTNRVIGPGIGLPAPQILYPANLTPAGIPYTSGNAEVSLAPGQSVQIPAGDWMIDLGKFSILEYQDPERCGTPGGGTTISQTSGVWRPIRTQRGTFTLRSDGINFRISNLTGCAVGGTITNSGNNYVQSSTTVTPSTGTSKWTAIVGGALNSLSCTAVGSNYGLAPVIYIPAPPAPGIQATAVATITAGSISGFTLLNAGAGYTTAPTITILPNPFDQATGINAAVASTTLTGSGTITGILLTNSGAPVASTMTLTVAGAGTSALITPLFLTTISALSITNFGSGFFTGAAFSTIGGIDNTIPAWAQAGGFLPRQASAYLSVTAGAAHGINLIDSGLFLGSASQIVTYYGGGPIDGTAANATTVQFTQGSANDTIIVQPI